MMSEYNSGKSYKDSVKGTKEYSNNKYYIKRYGFRFPLERYNFWQKSWIADSTELGTIFILKIALFDIHSCKDTPTLKIMLEFLYILEEQLKDINEGYNNWFELQSSRNIKNNFGLQYTRDIEDLDQELAKFEEGITVRGLFAIELTKIEFCISYCEKQIEDREQIEKQQIESEIKDSLTTNIGLANIH